MSDLDRRAALVTGGGMRIGAAIVRALALRGYAVAIHCNRARVAAEALRDEIAAGGRHAAVIQADFADAAATDGVVSVARAAIGPLTLLVNSASLFERDSAATLNAELFDRHLAINLRAPLQLARDFAAQAPAGQGASVVNITDQRVAKLTPDYLSYTLSKAALAAATVTLAQALAPQVRVNAVAPGPTLPNIRQRGEDFARQSEAVLLGRGPSPAEIAEAVLWLAQARAVTGQTIFVDGGQRLAWQTPDVAGIVE